MNDIGKGSFMIKKFSVGLVLVLLCLLLCAGGPAQAYSRDKPMVFKCAIDNPPGDMKAQTIKKIGDLVQERSQGRIKFKYFYGGSLIKKPQFADAVGKGIADISTGPVSFLTGKMPALSIFEVFGAYQLKKSPEMIEAVMPVLSDIFASKGIVPLMIQYTDTAVFCHKTKFLKSPADWKGQKMRLAGRWQSAAGEMWGGSPVFMPPSDLYLSLQRGVIDGYILIWDIVNGLKLYEVAPYIVDTGFSNNLEIITLNKKKFDSLTPEDQAILKKATKEVQDWSFAVTGDYYKKIEQSVIAKGGKVYHLSDAEKSAYLKAPMSLWPEVAKVAGPDGVKLIELLKPLADH